MGNAHRKFSNKVQNARAALDTDIHQMVLALLTVHAAGVAMNIDCKPADLYCLWSVCEQLDEIGWWVLVRSPPSLGDNSIQVSMWPRTAPPPWPRQAEPAIAARVIVA